MFSLKATMKGSLKHPLRLYTVTQDVNSKFLKENRINHIFTCPYTLAQNGRAERKHRQVVEVGLTLLAQAQLPMEFLWEAFHTATFLINRLPTLILSDSSPYQVLFQKIPDYNALHPFGCAIFPCLTPYNNNKL